MAAFPDSISKFYIGSVPIISTQCPSFCILRGNAHNIRQAIDRLQLIVERCVAAIKRLTQIIERELQQFKVNLLYQRLMDENHALGNRHNFRDSAIPAIALSNSWPLGSSIIFMFFAFSPGKQDSDRT